MIYTIYEFLKHKKRGTLLKTKDFSLPKEEKHINAITSGTGHILPHTVPMRYEHTYAHALPREQRRSYALRASAGGLAVGALCPRLTSGEFPNSSNGETKMFDNITYDREALLSTKREAGNSWRTSEGKADKFAQNALSALVLEQLSPMALAILVYEEMEPKNANGKACEPKESDKAASGVSVSSLRNAKGGEGARSCIEAIFYVAENASLDEEAVADFITGKRGSFKLFPLKRHLQAQKSKLAREEAEAAKGDNDSDEEPKEGLDEEAIATPLTEALEFIASLTGDDLAKHGDDIAALLTACREASDRLAAAETVRTGTNG